MVVGKKKLSDAQLKSKQEQRSLGEKLDRLRKTDGWEEIENITYSLFYENLEALMQEKNKEEMVTQVANLKAILDLAKRIGQKINIGITAKTILENHYKG